MTTPSYKGHLYNSIQQYTKDTEILGWAWSRVKVGVASNPLDIAAGGSLICSPAPQPELGLGIRRIEHLKGEIR